MNRFDEVRQRLAREDTQYQRCAQKHEQYEKRLDELQGLRFQNAEEQTEAVKLKKMKLSIKDEMERMVQKAAEAASASA